MKYSSIPSAQTIVQHCKAKNIKNIVISPGSRNAPLIIGFTEDTFFKCFSIVDERSAAFFALGIAQQINQPVAVLCTSGSALLNYYPAIAEAFYSGIPLLAISADRPAYKIDIGDGQTIRQDQVFQRHIGYSANLKQDLIHATDRVLKYAPHLFSNSELDDAQEVVQSYNDTELNTALNIIIEQNRPVHINVPFEEPLYNKVDAPIVRVAINSASKEIADDFEIISTLAKLWNGSTRKMVLVGVNKPSLIEQQYLDILANDPSVVVFTETTSNLHHPNFFQSIDSIVAPIEVSKNSEELFLRLQPDLLLTFGGFVISKKIKAFLRSYKPKQHWHVDTLKAFDTYNVLSAHLKMDVNLFMQKFIPQTSVQTSDYFGFWNSVKEGYKLKKDAYLAKSPFSDMIAFDLIAKNIPPHYNLQLANSSTVRYMQLFDLDPTIKVFCNRGTSGIDGSTSTAVGASIYNDYPTLLITGDLSFLYDSNALWNKYMKEDFKIILINNEGGGIFRILPDQEDSATYETYFETVQHYDISHLCKMYDLNYTKADNSTALEKCLGGFFQQKRGPSLLEVRTPRLLNNKILLAYFDFIS